MKRREFLGLMTAVRGLLVRPGRLLAADEQVKGEEP
jgi:hypothetical protein